MNEYLEKIVSNDKIPSPPMVAVRLLDLVTQPDVNVGEITKVLGADPKLSARLIAYCNSPIVGSKRMISSLQQAVMVLGMLPHPSSLKFAELAAGYLLKSAASAADAASKTCWQ